MKNASRFSDAQHADSIEDSTDPYLSPAERALLCAAGDSEAITLQLFQCLHCGHAYRPGELTCPSCGAFFAAGGRTNKMAVDGPLALKNSPVGKAMVENRTPIIFDIGGVSIALPIAETLIIGRLSQAPGDPQPDVNLNAFDADLQGVSRQHLKLTRRGDLIYMTDLGSSNGTFLNGRPITSHRERILRHGDELCLGYLKIFVRF
jgi:hypothetical protein